ncbi:MAG: hypothetical protein HN786_00810 [Cellvibrionales bacterium]|nr:hypothetical protein [Cellvibrionales bacterium]MBT7437146.1 hypothetical protein [Cellvibrionales bacterium]MCH9797436.1 PepSY domain-containing protein [Gammaproteobacteria bacterium]
MKSKLKHKISYNLRWHRRVGLSVMVVLIFLSITGILLNHSPAAGLSKRILNSEWLLSWYGFETVALSGFKVGKQWINHPGDREIYMDGQPVATCAPPLLNAARTDSFLIALCKDELVILSFNGELVEKINTLSGLPEHTTNVKYLNNTLFIQSHNKILSLDPDTLKIKPSQITIESWPLPSSLPSTILEELKQSSQIPGISLETVILDLHSGRFFGDAGVLFVDFMGLLTVFLAMTGTYVWFLKRRKKHMKRQKKLAKHLKKEAKASQ